uniref:Uncharacterized protein n=1 Tax=Physcomitrium patens TaxID=3218 RepID=A0A2K1LBG8_PHYPA|nr:hypothetical protein PHYPA_001801 [Physcomitrium patens]
MRGLEQQVRSCARRILKNRCHVVMDGNDTASLKVNARCGSCRDLKVGFLHCDIEAWVHESSVLLRCNTVRDAMKVGGTLRTPICLELAMYTVKRQNRMHFELTPHDETLDKFPSTTMENFLQAPTPWMTQP